MVFDGWFGGDLEETRDRQAGILIYSSPVRVRKGRRGSSERLLTTERQRAVVVTSDREIQTWAQEVGSRSWITAPQFEMQYLLAPAGEPGEESEESGPRRLKRWRGAHRLPKGERRRQQRLKKL